MIPLIANDIKRSDARFIIFFTLIHIQFYNCVFVRPIRYLFFILNILFSLYFLICFLKCREKGTTIVDKSMTMWLICFWMSAVVGGIGGQNLIYWFKAISGSYLIIGFYFYLKLKRISVDFLYRLLIYMLLGNILITILCYIQFPDCWFGINTYEDDIIQSMIADSQNRNLMRFVLPCKFLSPLFILYLLQNRQFDLRTISLLGILGLSFILIGNRFPMLILTVCVFFMLMFFSSIRISKKIQTVFVVVILLLIVFSIPFTRNILTGLIGLTNDQYDSFGEDNIRVLAATYFFTEFNDGDVLHSIIGNGIAVHDSGSYSDRLEMIAQTFAYYTSDVGFAFVYVSFGIVGLFLFAFWLFSVLKKKVPKGIGYIKVYFLFIVLSMICGNYWFENLLIMSILCYILNESHLDLINENNYN